MKYVVLVKQGLLTKVIIWLIQLQVIQTMRLKSAYGAKVLKYKIWNNVYNT